MTRSEFLSMDWSDSQIGYDMQVGVPDGDSRTIAYLTLSKKYPNSLCLVTDSKEFPVMNSGCGLSENPIEYEAIVAEIQAVNTDNSVFHFYFYCIC